MTLKELKKYINTIPDEYDNLLVVNGEFCLAKDGNTFVMTNNEVMTVFIDNKTGEIQFLHQTDKDVKDMILGLDNIVETDE